MELTDIIPVESWRELAEDIHTRFGFNSCIYNKDNLIIHSPVGWANEVCPLIKAGESRVICATSQQNLARKLQENRTPLIDECEAGFSKFLVPIFANGDFLGSAGGCGCLLTDNRIDTFYISKAVGKTEDEINQLLTTIPRISRDRIKEALSYLQDHIRRIMEEGR
ncbi:MAG: PocR ligand-binding domain-containing protein [Nitrospirota bacterium]